LKIIKSISNALGFGFQEAGFLMNTPGYC